MTHPLSLALTTALALAAGAARCDPTPPHLPEPLVADYQIGGSYPPPAGVTVVVRHHTALPEPGLFNICHVNAFQIPAGSAWQPDLLVRGPDGTPLTDPHWPHDHLLDISTAQTRARNFLMVLPMLLSCIHKGFKGVAFDSLDSYSYSKGRLSLQDSAAFAKLLVSVTRDNGLLAGQKNTPEMGRYGRDKIGFGFAIVEECYLWDDCAAYTDVYGPNVIGIEYADDLRGTFADACADPTRPASLILRDRMVVPMGHIDYVDQHC